MYFIMTCLYKARRSRTIAKVMRFKNVRFTFKLTWYSCYRNEVVTEFRGFLVI